MEIKNVLQTQSVQEMQSNTSRSMQRSELNQNQNIQQEAQKEMGMKEKRNITSKDLEKAMQSIEEKLKLFSTQLKIERDKESGLDVIKIIDIKNKEVIRQIPPDAVLRIAKYVDEITGILFNEKA